jgi:hypothetical protein
MFNRYEEMDGNEMYLNYPTLLVDTRTPVDVAMKTFGRRSSDFNETTKENDDE